MPALCSVSRRFAPMAGVPLVLALGATPAKATALLPGLFEANASAGFANLQAGPLASQLVRLASVACPCGGSQGKTSSNSVGPVTIPGLIAVGTTAATASGYRSPTAAGTTETASIAGLSLFGGLLQAQSLVAKAHLTATATGFTVSGSGSVIKGLSIAGKPIATPLMPNTTLPLPGIGSVTFLSETKGGDGVHKEVFTVDMIRVSVTQTNGFALPVGATITLAEARAGYERLAPPATTLGQAFVANTTAAGIDALPDFGRLGGAFTGCAGTRGKTITNSVAAISEGGISIGGGTTTAFGGAIGTGVSQVQTSSTLTGIDLLGGLISATGIKSVATETVTGKTVTASTAGTEFGSLVVAGLPLPVNVAPNTTIPLPLLGYVVVNEQTGPAAGQTGPLTVNGLHIVVTTPNLMGLPVGTEIFLASASADGLPLPK